MAGLGRRELAGAAALGALILLVEALLIGSYLRSSQAIAEFSGTSHFLTTLANLQREVLRLEVEFDGAIAAPELGTDALEIQRDILASQIRTLAGARTNLPEAATAYESVVAQRPAITGLLDEFIAGDRAPELAARLRDVLREHERTVKRAYDGTEIAYFQRMSESLAAQESAQLVMAVVAVAVALLAIILGLLLRRRVKAEFAQAYFRLEAEMSERRRAQEQLEHQAYHDSLTGLPNRARFLDRLAASMAAPDRQRVAVLFIDVDDFKVINDSRGHDTGDQVLVMFAERIAGCLRPGDLAGRLGGDEFAVLLTGLRADGIADRVANRIVATIRRPFIIDGNRFTVRATLGLAESAAGEASVTADDLLRNADIAMYAAKSQGKGRVVTFKPEMHEHAVSRLGLLAELQRAIPEQQFVLHYQPIVELASGAIQGVEALVRWRHPERGLLGPGEFIPLAEEAGLIGAIDRWVLNEACRTATELGTRLSVNLSLREVQEGDQLVDRVARTLSQSGMAPGDLTLELTESVLIEDVETASEILGRLKRLGVRLAIDDFGTGFSSLSYLTRFPIDTLKVDRSFIQALDDGDGHVALARTIFGLGGALGIDTIAEGIEKPEQVELLQAFGCELGQGFLLARPMEKIALMTALGHEPAPTRPRARVPRQRRVSVRTTA